MGTPLRLSLFSRRGAILAPILCAVAFAACNCNGPAPLKPTCVGRECLPAPTCSDGSKNGAETDVDCGGDACPKCLDGQVCLVPSDCVGDICANGICASASCVDGIKNGVETDVDCGGGVCPGCALGQTCLVPSDCLSGNCDKGICAPPAGCTDGIQNGTETDVDCGGACPACLDGKLCRINADCQRGMCGVDGRCSAANSLDPNLGYISNRPVATDSAGVMHVVYFRGGNIMDARLQNGSWSQALITAPTPPAQPSTVYRMVANSAGRLFLVYTTTQYPGRDLDVPYLSTYTPSTGWTAPVDLRANGLLRNPPTAEYHQGFDLAVDAQDNLHVLISYYAWDNSNFSTDYFKWDSAAATQLAQTHFFSGPSGRPVLFIDEDGQIHAVYDGYYQGNPLYYRSSTDGGATWSVEESFSSRANIDTSMGLAVVKESAGKSIYLSHEDATGQLEVLLRSAPATWTPAYTSNEPGLEHRSPMNAVVGGRLQIYFVGSKVSGSPHHLRRIVKDAAWGPIENLDDNPDFSVFDPMPFGLGAATWPLSSRPTAKIPVVKLWQTGVAPASSYFALFNLL